MLCITPALHSSGCFTESPTGSKNHFKVPGNLWPVSTRGEGVVTEPLGEMVPGGSQHSLGWANPDPKQEPAPAHCLSLVPGRAPAGWQSVLLDRCLFTCPIVHLITSRRAAGALIRGECATEHFNPVGRATDASSTRVMRCLVAAMSMLRVFLRGEGYAVALPGAWG